MATIRRHNAGQILLGVLGWVGALFASSAMVGFFGGVWFLVTFFAGFEDFETWSLWFGLAMMGLIWLLGVVRYRQGLGGIDYWDSIDSLLPRSGSGGAVAVDYYASQVTAPGVVISSLFVAAPRWLIEGTKQFCRLIPARREFADRMEVLREQLDLTRRWKPLGEYADVIEELQ